MPFKNTLERLGDAFGLLILIAGLLFGANLLRTGRRDVIAERRGASTAARPSAAPRRRLTPAV